MQEKKFHADSDFVDQNFSKNRSFRVRIERCEFEEIQKVAPESSKSMEI